MRLTAMALAEGCRKFTVSCGAMLKLFQKSDRFWLDCLMVVVTPDWEMLPEPAATCPPFGAAWARAAQSDRAAAISLRLDRLPRPRANAATATEVLYTWLPIRR